MREEIKQQQQKRALIFKMRRRRGRKNYSTDFIENLFSLWSPFALRCMQSTLNQSKLAKQF